MQELLIQRVRNGVIVTCGCAKFVTQNINQAVEHIRWWLEDPHKEAKRLEDLGWIKADVIETPVVAAPVALRGGYKA